MVGTFAFAGRPFASTPLLPRPFQVAAVDGQYGYAAWSFSRQAKLNAWSWHGVGRLLNVNNWATLGNAVYMRSEADTAVYVTRPDTFLDASATNHESTSVEATTQWLDFKSPGKRKALTGIDFDGAGISSVEIYVSAGGSREGVLAETIAIGSSQDGWTYSGELLPLSCDGTEFKLRFIAEPNIEAQINRLTLHYEDIQG